MLKHSRNSGRVIGALGESSVITDDSKGEFTSCNDDFRLDLAGTIAGSVGVIESAAPASLGRLPLQRATYE